MVFGREVFFPSSYLRICHHLPSDIPFITATSILRYAIFPAGLISLRTVNALLVKLFNISNLFVSNSISPDADTFSPTASEMRLDKFNSPSSSFSRNQRANPARKLISLLIHSPTVLAPRSLFTILSSDQYFRTCSANLFSIKFASSSFSLFLRLTFSEMFLEIQSYLQ